MKEFEGVNILYVGPFTYIRPMMVEFNGKVKNDPFNENIFQIDYNDCNQKLIKLKKKIIKYQKWKMKYLI